MAQIFVKVNGSKATPMEVNLTDDKVKDVMRQIQEDKDVYVTMQGKVLRRNEKLKRCGVSDGCTIQVMSKMRGGGRRKDKKKSKAEKKQAARTRTVEQKFADEVAIQGCDRDTVVRMIEENEENRKVMVQMLEENDDDRKMILSMSEGSDAEMEQQLQNFRTACREVLEWK